MTKLVQGTKVSDDGRAVTCPGRSMRYEINFKNYTICIAWGLARPVAPFNVENSFFSGLSPKHSTTLEGAIVCEHLFEVNFVPGGSMFHGQLARRIDCCVAGIDATSRPQTVITLYCAFCFRETHRTWMYSVSAWAYVVSGTGPVQHGCRGVSLCGDKPQRAG